MAKELPYFKFEPNQWENGNIQLCTFEAQGIFINLCSMYWQRLGDLPYKLAVQKICKGNATAFDSLINDEIIRVIDGMVCIDFLNEQLSEFENISNVNSENARIGWEKRRNKANAMRPHSEGNAIREEKIREDKKKKDKSIKENALTFEERELNFRNRVAEFIDEYPKEMLRAFYDYWTEKNDGGAKMRFEMQKVFDISRRLKTWKKNERPGKQITTLESRIDGYNEYFASKGIK